MTFVAFDILTHKGKDLRHLPLMERKAILEDAVLENGVVKRVRYLEHGFIPFYEICKQKQLEGIVLKAKNSKYYAGKRSPGRVWERVLVYQRAECVIRGYSTRNATWLIGIQNENGISPAGALKFGVNSAIGKSVYPLLKKLTIREADGYAYVEPIIKIGVRFRHWTDSGHMRLPVLEEVLM